jgi:hypothetical protein
MLGMSPGPILQTSNHTVRIEKNVGTSLILFRHWQRSVSMQHFGAFFHVIYFASQKEKRTSPLPTSKAIGN